MLKELPKENNNPIGENSPNLVTLLAHYKTYIYADRERCAVM
jgi:hypothetical protein